MYINSLTTEKWIIKTAFKPGWVSRCRTKRRRLAFNDFLWAAFIYFSQSPRGRFLSALAMDARKRFSPWMRRRLFEWADYVLTLRNNERMPLTRWLFTLGPPPEIVLWKATKIFSKSIGGIYFVIVPRATPVPSSTQKEARRGNIILMSPRLHKRAARCMHGWDREKWRKKYRNFGPFKPPRPTDAPTLSMNEKCYISHTRIRITGKKRFLRCIGFGIGMMRWCFYPVYWCKHMNQRAAASWKQKQTKGKILFLNIQ